MGDILFDMVKLPRLSKKQIQATVESLSDSEMYASYNRSLSKEAYVAWTYFYRWALEEGIDPKSEEMRDAANGFREYNGLKSSPRTQRAVLGLVYGEDALPKTRTEKAREKALEDANVDPMQQSIRDLKKGIDRTILEIEEAKSRLQKATAQHEKYTQALQAITAALKS